MRGGRYGTGWTAWTGWTRLTGWAGLIGWLHNRTCAEILAQLGKCGDTIRRGDIDIYSDTVEQAKRYRRSDA